MPPALKPGHAPVRFDAQTWAQDLAANTSAARAAAETWRAAVDRDGQPLDQLRPCSSTGRDGTDLTGCAKVYIPQPIGDWGAILRVARDPQTGRAVLLCVAFGLRHPPKDSRRRSVYQIGHQRLNS